MAQKQQGQQSGLRQDAYDTSQCIYQIASIFMFALVALCAVMCGLNILQVLKIKGHDSFLIKDNILYVPLLRCIPTNIEILGLEEFSLGDSNSTMPATVAPTLSSVELEDGMMESQCRLMSPMIWDTLVGLGICIIAATVYIVAVNAIRMWTSDRFNAIASSTAISILFMCALVQTGTTTGSLVEENEFWLDHYEEWVQTTDMDSIIDSVESYGNLLMLKWGAEKTPLAVAFFVLMDTVLYPCCNVKHNNSIYQQRQEDEEPAPTKPPSATIATGESTDQVEAELDESFEVDSESNIMYTDPEFSLTSERPPWCATA